jgi:hypothetical protein
MSNSPKLISKRFTPQISLPKPEESLTSSQGIVDPEKMISESERNNRFKVLKKKKQNKKCCDCSAKFPQWASASFGILICMNCSGKHRFLGPNISFVRSIAMDNWKEHEMRAMEKGGNKRFKDYLESEMIEGDVDYTSEDIQRYKDMLLDEVQQEFKGFKGEKKANSEKDTILEDKKTETKPETEMKKEKKMSLEINKEDLTEKKEVKPLTEQKTKVVMAESKQKSGNSESTGGKRGRRRGKDKKFAGKRIKKVNLDQLVKDDLKVKSQSGIKKKGLFTEVKKEEPQQEEDIKEEKSSGMIHKKSKNFLSSKNVQQKLADSKLKKFSGFGSDNMMEETSTVNTVEATTSGNGFGVFGGYGSDDLNPPKRKVPVEANNGQQEGNPFIISHFFKINFTIIMELKFINGKHLIKLHSVSCGRKPRKK